MMFLKILFLLFASCLSFPANNRTKKLFPIGFTRLENNPCVALNGRSGTCYTKSICRSINGITSGPCQTIGSCCVIQRTCGATSAYNNTYFVNPNFPNFFTGGAPCTIVIPRCNSGICQLKISLLTLSLAQPNGTGYCTVDSLIISGGASQVPVICGENSGQHIFLEFNQNQNIQIMINTNSAFSFTRQWTILVQQIPCSSPALAPNGCLMYHNTLSGTITSFNYGPSVSGDFNGDPSMLFPGTRELANLNYGICVGMIPGFCSIEWSQTPNDPYSFTITNNTIQVVPLPGDPVVGTNCSTDFVVIPNPTNIMTDRFCGNQLIAQTTSTKPFVITVVTNGDEIGDVGNRGFSINYRQLPCHVNVFAYRK